MKLTSTLLTALALGLASVATAQGAAPERTATAPEAQGTFGTRVHDLGVIQVVKSNAPQATLEHLAFTGRGSSPTTTYVDLRGTHTQFALAATPEERQEANYLGNSISQLPWSKEVSTIIQSSGGDKKKAEKELKDFFNNVIKDNKNSLVVVQDDSGNTTSIIGYRDSAAASKFANANFANSGSGTAP